MKAIKIILVVMVVGIFFTSCLTDVKQEGVFTPGNRTYFTEKEQGHVFVDTDGDGVVDIIIKLIPKDVFDSIKQATAPIVFDVAGESKVYHVASGLSLYFYSGHKSLKDDEFYDDFVKSYFTTKR